MGPLARADLLVAFVVPVTIARDTCEYTRDAIEVQVRYRRRIAITLPHASGRMLFTLPAGC
jgi:hypothetical protein